LEAQGTRSKAKIARAKADVAAIGLAMDLNTLLDLIVERDVTSSNIPLNTESFFRGYLTRTIYTSGKVSTDGTNIDINVGDGIDIVSDAVEVDITDLVGTGIEDDGSNNFRITAQGNGLTGGGGTLLSVLAGSGIVVAAFSGSAQWAQLDVNNLVAITLSGSFEDAGLGVQRGKGFLPYDSDGTTRGARLIRRLTELHKGFNLYGVFWPAKIMSIGQRKADVPKGKVEYAFRPLQEKKG